MSRLPGILNYIAEQQGVSERTIERRLASGKYRGLGFYQTKGGHWRFRKLPSDQVEQIIRAQTAVALRHIKAEFFPHFDEVMELTYVAAGITNDDVRSVTHSNLRIRKRNVEKLKRDEPEKWKLLCHTQFEIDMLKFKYLSKLVQEPRIRLGIKGQILRLHGYEVTPKNLAAILAVSVPTLYRRFGRDVVRQVCQSDSFIIPSTPTQKTAQTVARIRQQNANGVKAP
jgi:AraC-like DNA-binding protein